MNQRPIPLQYMTPEQRQAHFRANYERIHAELVAEAGSEEAFQARRDAECEGQHGMTCRCCLTVLLLLG